MTRREAIKVLERLKIASKACGSTSDDRTYDKAVEALDIALAALRGPAREQVEAWRGEWIDKPTGRYGQWQTWCSACGKHSGIGGIKNNRHRNFCPNCGCPQTDEAVDIVMKRFEKLYEDK